MRFTLHMFVLLVIAVGSFVAGVWFTQKQKDTTPPYDFQYDTCMKLACQGASEEIKHWLYMYSEQEDRLTEVVALNRIYQAIMNRNPECYKPIKFDDVEDRTSPSP